MKSKELFIYIKIFKKHVFFIHRSDEPLAKQQIELSATDGFQNTTIFFRITSGGSPNDTLLDYEKRQTVEFSVEIYFKLLPYYFVHNFSLYVVGSHKHK